MSLLQPQFKLRDFFLDSDAVQRALSPGKRRLLTRFGGFTRVTARRSIRPGRMKSLSEMAPDERDEYRRQQELARHYGRPAPKRPRLSSRPGEAPRDVTGTLKRHIYFAADLNRESVVIGPEQLGGVAAENAPEVAEYGGRTVITGGPDKGRTVTLAPRPFMHPAFQSALDHVDLTDLT